MAQQKQFRYFISSGDFKISSIFFDKKKAWDSLVDHFIMSFEIETSLILAKEYLKKGYTIIQEMDWCDDRSRPCDCRFYCNCFVVSERMKRHYKIETGSQTIEKKSIQLRCKNN